MRFSWSTPWKMRWTKMPACGSGWGPAPGRDELLDLGDGDPTGHGHRRVEVLGGGLEDEVAGGVALPRLHDGEVGRKGRLEDVRLAVEFADLLALGHFGSVSGRREEGRDARATRPAALASDPCGIRSTSSSPDSIWRSNSSFSPT